jgi:ADP-ribosyl-[dinitrogen reductase] hydrolase
LGSGTGSGCNLSEAAQTPINANGRQYAHGQDVLSASPVIVAVPAASPDPDWPGAVLDRARGALLGLAIGDALGTTLEFSRRDAHPHQSEMTGGGPFGLDPGQWTDDTAMALALADSLLHARGGDEHGGLEPTDLMRRFTAWWREGRYSCTGTCFDIGITTRDALARFARTGDAFAGSAAETAAGNGSLMRLAPAALSTLGDPRRAVRLARAQSRTTHAAPQCLDGCAFLVELMHDAILGEPDARRPRATAADPAIQALVSGAYRGKARHAIRSSGYIVDTLEAALWAVAQTTSFEAALVLAVNLGDDSDTVGAVTGQLAGAIYGASAIPARWLAPLAWRERIEALADALLRASPLDQRSGRPGP